MDNLQNRFHLDNVQGGTPIYLRVAEMFRRMILSGELSHGEKLPPEATLASMLGINHQTLRKGFAILSEQKLITQCKGRGSFVHLPQQQCMRIGVLVTEFSQFSEDLYVLRMLAALNSAMGDKYHGEFVLISVASPAELLPRLNQSHCDGLIVLYANSAVRRRLCQEDFNHFPMVFINAQTANLSSYGRYEVRMAENMVEMAVNALYEKGHRNIGFISCIDRANLRLTTHNKKFLECMAHLGLSTDYVKLGRTSAPAGTSHEWYFQACSQAYQLCTGKKRPTAIFCPGFTFSCGAWQGIMDAGLRIPDDVAFLGFNANSNVNPKMSALLHPVAQIADKTLEILFSFNAVGKHQKILCYEFPAIFNHPNVASF